MNTALLTALLVASTITIGGVGADHNCPSAGAPAIGIDDSDGDGIFDHYAANAAGLATIGGSGDAQTSSYGGCLGTPAGEFVAAMGAAPASFCVATPTTGPTCLP